MPQVALRHIPVGSVVEVPTSLWGRSGAPCRGIWAQPQFNSHGSHGSMFGYLFDGAGTWQVTPAISQDTTFEVVEDASLLALAKSKKIDPLSISSISGTDPEIFVVGDKGLIPAWEYLPGKEAAIKFTGSDYGMRNHSYEFWDGFQAEFCPYRAGCLEVLHDHIRQGLAHVRTAARKYNPKAELSLASSIEVPDYYLKNASDDNVIFRCSPSMNVYHDAGGQIPNPREYKLRFAGGHLHYGTDQKWTAPVYAEIIKALDGILGVAGVSLAAGFDTPERRTMYGRAGEFRLPSHGIEYRVLSNFWLCHPAISQLVHELFRRVVRFAISGFYTVCWEADQEKVREVINLCDVAGARAMLIKNRSILQQLFEMSSPNGGRWPLYLATRAVDTIMNGIGYAIKDPTAITPNWCLEGTWNQYGRQTNAQWSTLESLPQSLAPRAQELEAK